MMGTWERERRGNNGNVTESWGNELWMD